MNTPISPSRPIAVDLDGTLIKGDMMMEAAVAMITKNPLFVFCLPLWLLRGRAFMKEKIARYAPPLPGAHLPYRHNLLAWLREQKRPLVLATAAHKTHAEAVAKHLGIFSAVLATENGVNLSGKNKAQQLCKLYGEHNFDYAGNSRADIAVWQHAANAIVVAAPRSVRNNIGIPVLHSITDDGIIAKLRHWRRAIRPRHWLKNLLLFVAVVGGHQLFSPPVLGASVLAFAVFCLMASAAYLLNDIFDLQHDRTNENKKRPAAAGDIGIAESFGAAILLYAAAAYLAFYLPPPFVYIAGFYGAATLIYSLWLKRALLLDVLSLSVFFTARIVAGGAATGIELSFYLLSFALFLFLSLALLKRHGELLKLSAGAAISGRAYRTQDAPILAALGAAAGMIAIFILTLYLDSAEVRARYENPEMLFLTLPLMIYWISRIWLLSARGKIGGDPVVYVFRDRPSLICGALLLSILWLSA